MEKRKLQRAKAPMEVSILCDSGSIYRGTIIDISLAGVKIDIFKICDMGLRECEEGILKIHLGGKVDPHIAEVTGKILRKDENTVIYALNKASLKDFMELKKTVIKYIGMPEKVIEEVRHHPNIGLNCLYIPAMNEAIEMFVTQAVKDIFAIYLNTEVQSGAPVNFPDLSVTGVSAFNGALYGNIILRASFNTAGQWIRALLEISKDKINNRLIIDGFGEITNMIAGGVQTGLSEQYENISLVPPLVFIGSQCQYGSDLLFSLKNHFKSDVGDFSVESLFTII
ncbi:MAG: chemotaxis protein CheX [Magnetococcus sp. DMHC-6]